MARGGRFRVVYEIEAFDGGLNNKYSPNIIANNESPDCLNVVFDDRGGVQTRRGSKKFNTTAVGSFAGDGLFTARFNDGTEQMLGWWNGTMYKLTGTTTFTTVPSAQSVFTAGTRVDMFMYENQAFFGNGGSTPYKYNGTDFTRQGVPQPNSTPAHTSGTAGVSGAATGDVNYKVSYVNSFVVEGDVSTFTATLTVASTATVSLTSLPLAPTSFGVAARKLYRRDSSSGGIYKLVTTISDNTTTTFVDQVAPANLGASAPADNGEPPNWKYSVTHQERAFLVDPAEPQLVYYTELGNPYVVKTTNFQKVQSGDGESINALGVHANALAIGKDASVWLIYMQDTDPSNWVVIKTNSKYGYASHYGKADYAQLQLFIGKRYDVIQGFYALAGIATQPNSQDLTVATVYSDSQSDRIEPEVFTFSEAGISKSCAIEYKNKLWFSVPYSSATNDRVFQFDFQRRDKTEASGGSWAPFTYPFGIAAFTIYGGLLYAQAANATGFVYQLENSLYNDDSTAINSYYWTKEFYGYPEHIENWKDFRIANFIVEPLGAYYMNLSYRIDADAGIGITSQIDLNPGNAVWGAFSWGEELWGSGQTRKKVTVFTGPGTGKRIQFRFDNQNAVNQAFHVFPASTFSYNVRGTR